MLNYFKKRKDLRSQGIRRDEPFRNSDNVVSEGNVIHNRSVHGASDVHRHSLKSSSSFCDEILSQVDMEDDGVDGAGSCGGSVCGLSLVSDDDIFRYKSRLAMPISSIVSDPNCLIYFVQYLDTRGALPLLKFYLDIENFKSAAIVQSKIELQNDLETLESGDDIQRCNEFKNQTNTRITFAQEDEKNANSEDNKDKVPELKSFYDLSMRQPLTDDEKSQIYAETNKQISQCNENTRTIDINNTSIVYSNKNTRDWSNEDMDQSGTKKCVGPASVNDAIAIYQKYLIANAKQFVALPVTVLSEISLVLCQRLDDEQQAFAPHQTGVINMPTISATCFDGAQNYVMNALERLYLNDFYQSPFYSKYSLELIQHGQPELSIYDILYSEVTLFFFMEFLEQRGERECLDFWTSAINFRKTYETTNIHSEKTMDSTIEHPTNEKSVRSDAQADAMIIYEKFFSLQRDKRFWLSDRLRSQVEEHICAADRISQCFDLSLQLLAKYLEQKYFQDFLKSQLFQNYLNELKTKWRELEVVGSSKEPNAVSSAAVGAGGIFGKTLHRKTLSDCSVGASKREISNRHTHNTLLAMDSIKLPQARIKSLQQTGSSDLNIDARHLTNPNLLWRRSHSTDGVGLKFGHINELGRYERDFEAVDAVGGESGGGAGKPNWSLSFNGNKIKNAMRKLVHLPEDKVQEEIAWQVAEMIIKDVTSVTLGNHEMNSTLTPKSRCKDTSGKVSQ
ncbi:A-kinase anchor protein 10, mitochondrial [Ceratitis capitata]|uniref:A-kinase anchor protein 10, mitochondrial n=1 Tax=Ceratitis capitata TaxID=7213 RepID=W8BKE6_CERCA|nr:A-kinase anchor protein 10, mitochondrial [Ceratitis capitata]